MNLVWVISIACFPSIMVFLSRIYKLLNVRVMVPEVEIDKQYTTEAQRVTIAKSVLDMLTIRLMSTLTFYLLPPLIIVMLLNEFSA
ncbi:MAG: hypothetical protein ABIA47_02115 [bacterium]